MKKLWTLALAALFLAAAVIPYAVSAEGGLSVTASSVTADYPMNLRFNVSVSGNDNITDIRLHYSVQHEGFADVTSEVYLDFKPASKVDTSWTWDMRKTGGLPPESRITYWWTAVDARGNKTATSPAVFQFDDKRYKWQTLTEGLVTIKWYNGDKTFADKIMSSAQDALGRLEKTIGAKVQKPVKIFIYANANDLRGAMIFPQEWTGGVTYTGYGVLAIGIAPDNLAWGQRAISHELTHLIVHQVIFNPYSDLPVWLDEGLAMYNEGPLEASFQSVLDQAIKQGTLISVKSLASPFSASSELSYLSYAESYSVIEYLVTQYGQGKMLALLDTFRKGSTYDNALQQVYGFDMARLNTLWREYLAGKQAKAKVVAEAVAVVPALA